MTYWYRITFVICFALLLVTSVSAENRLPQVSVMHYFADDLGHAGIKAIFDRFTVEQKVAVLENPVGHEDFKTIVLQMAAEGQLPDVVSYWAGARTQFLVDGGVLAPLDRLWQQGGYSDLIPAAIAKTASSYAGKRYLIPFGYHSVGLFYNPQTFQKAGIKQPPSTWEEFLSTCDKLQLVGIKPLALGAKNRWPAQFWFDYLLLRTAGPEFRQQLMTGQASYTDPRVQAAMSRWQLLLEKNYFAPGLTTASWADAADMVSSGAAAMTLMGTWVSGYWNGKGVVAETGYDFFPFPEIDPKQPRVVIGPVDGMVVAAGGDMAAAEKLINFLLTDLAAQEHWAKTQGALAVNRQVSEQIYNPVVTKALQEVKAAEVFAFSFDLATTPPMAEQGLTTFSQFLEDPSRIPTYLQDLQTAAEQVFGH